MTNAKVLSDAHNRLNEVKKSILPTLQQMYVGSPNLKWLLKVPGAAYGNNMILYNQTHQRVIDQSIVDLLNDFAKLESSLNSLRSYVEYSELIANQIK